MYCTHDLIQFWVHNLYAISHLLLETAPVFVAHQDPLDHQSYPAELLFPQSFQDSVMGILKLSEKRQISAFWYVQKILVIRRHNVQRSSQPNLIKSN